MRPSTIWFTLKQGIKNIKRNWMFSIASILTMAACIFHQGSYNTLHKTYAMLLQYIEENGYEICGNIRESYIDGVWNKDSDAEWLTEIQIPVQRIENERE